MPGTPTRIHARRALVVAPHYDDEVFGCGGLLAQLAAGGTGVHALFLTDSSGGTLESTADPAAYAAARRTEAEAAGQVLGIGTLHHLGLPDGRLVDHPEAIGEALRTRLGELCPDLLLVPSPLEASADHRIGFAAVYALLAALRKGDPLLATVAPLRILAYEINHPLYPDLLVDVGAQVPVIERAIACYASQTARHPYGEACLGLLRYRTHSLLPEVEAAEGYADLSIEDFRTHSLAGLIRDLGGAPERLEVREGPRLSVVVRTKDRPQRLAQALDSLAASHYRKAEIIVVNDGGAPPALPTDHPLPIRRLDLAHNRGRSGAANAGLAEARGDAIVFLDDDDLVEPEHLGVLAGLLAAAGVRVAYTDAAVGVYELGGADGWICRERRLPYSRDFDPELLLYDNYIPFHTVVFARTVVDAVGPLDEDLPFFEDWDWLIRCAARTRFHHQAQVTCEYRQFVASGDHVLGHTPRERGDFLAMKARVIAKHAARANPQAAAKVVDTLRAEAVAGEEQARHLRLELAASEARFHQRNGALENLRAEQRGLAAELRGAEARAVALYERLTQRDGALYERDATLRATYAEIERLGGLIRTMESSRAWRLHRWWQRWRRG